MKNVDLSQESWTQLKKMQRRIGAEIERREQEAPSTYQCAVCQKFHGSQQAIYDHLDKQHGGVGVCDERAIPLWK